MHLRRVVCCLPQYPPIFSLTFAGLPCCPPVLLSSGYSFPGGAEELSMKEEMWMLCNLDENLLFSQFHPASQASLQGERRHVPHGTSTAAAASTVTPDNRPNGTAPAAHQRRSAPPAGGTANHPPHGTAGSIGHAGGDRRRGGGGGDGSSLSGWRGGGSSQAALSAPARPVAVKRSRREERVTFYARPSCHDFMGGWAGGRARGGVSPSRSQEFGGLARDEGAGRGVGGKGSGRDASESTDSATRKGKDEAAGGTGGRPRGPTDGNGGGTSNGVEGDGSGGGGDPEGGKDDRRGSNGGRCMGRVVAVGFKSGECAVLDATVTDSPSVVSVLNKGGAYCEGRVTSVRFVPRAGQRVLVAAFSTGDVYTFDVALSKEAPLGPAAEKAKVADGNAASGSNNPAATGGGGGGAGPSSGGSGAGSKKRASNGRGGGGNGQGKSAQDKDGSGSGGSWGRRSNHGGSTSTSSSSCSAPPLPASFTGAGERSGVKKGARGRSPPGRRFLVERNSVVGANPMSRWRVTSDGREVTEMAFSPCEVDGRRLIALAALDGVSCLLHACFFVFIAVCFFAADGVLTPCQMQSRCISVQCCSFVFWGRGVGAAESSAHPCLFVSNSFIFL